ncbi:hypothetical protein MLD38_004379 [Melastoma candidum]|uniref:Uncharacterized protein n=1 Tax=Melastoma candidum TaxID=119954 RepID=A0ACB9SA60_9MYRT|nr:hypothetical protein MLD38_004379 [Melastoma candidum]
MLSSTFSSWSLCSSPVKTVPWIKEGKEVSSPVAPMVGLGLWGFRDVDQILGDGWGRVQLLQPAFLDGNRMHLPIHCPVDDEFQEVLASRCGRVY